MKKIFKYFLALVIVSFGFNVYASEDATLKNIKINDQNVVCDNSANENEYICKLNIDDNEVTNVKITYEANSESAVLSDNSLEKSLSAGENTFTVTVTNGETINKYVFLITKTIASEDTTLKKLVINGEEVTLSKGTAKYTTTVSHATTKLEVAVTPNDSKAKVVDIQGKEIKNNKLTFDFLEEEKEFKFKVVAESKKEVQTYVIKVTKREEKDASLKSITIKEATIDFASAIYEYQLTVLKSVESLNIEAVPTDSEAKVKIDKPEKLALGDNTVTITVENDGNKKTYVIKVKRLDREDDTVANLESLTIEGYELNFKPDQYEYNLTINNDVNILNITPKTANLDAKYEITGNVDLENGSIIKIKVNYNDDITNVYRINIIKEEAKEEKNSLGLIIVLVIIALLLIGLGIFFIIRNKKKKSKKTNKKKETPVVDAKEENITKIGDGNKTELAEATSSSDIINIESDDMEEDII